MNSQMCCMLFGTTASRELLIYDLHGADDIFHSVGCYGTLLFTTRTNSQFPVNCSNFFFTFSEWLKLVVVTNWSSRGWQRWFPLRGNCTGLQTIAVSFITSDYSHISNCLSKSAPMNETQLVADLLYPCYSPIQKQVLVSFFLSALLNGVGGHGSPRCSLSQTVQERIRGFLYPVWVSLLLPLLRLP